MAIDWEQVPPLEDVGGDMHELMRELFPICRSLTGDGVRETLRLVSREVELELTEVASGTQVFDWAVPREWNIAGAWIDDPEGNRVVDFEDSNLHVLGYSTPIRAKMPLAELREHVFTHAVEPDWVPFRTSYYSENWGFCMSRTKLESLREGQYDVCIDSTLADGRLSYGETLIPGQSDEEFLLSTYVCHPSLANDNLSGIVLLATLGKYLRRMPLRYSYRLLFSPGTIGPITWLAHNAEAVARIRHGLVVSCVGDPGGMTYKRSRRGDAEIDRAVVNVLRDSGRAHTVLDWFPWGGDERQFCSPGLNLPVGALSRTPADKFPEYHSSADDLEFVRPEALADSLGVYLSVIDVIETNETYVNQHPQVEPQLGKRGLYRSIGGGSSEEAALLWVLNLSDGEHSLLDISDRSGLPLPAVREAARRLLEHDLLAPR